MVDLFTHSGFWTVIPAVILLVIYLMLKIKSYDWKEVVVKGVVSCLFITCAIITLLANKTYLPGWIIVAGLVFGLSGDILLDLKYVCKEKHKLFTNLGFLVFGLGHLCFIAAMISVVPNGTDAHALYFILPVLGACLIGFAILALEKPMKLVFGDMKLACFLYSICLFSTPLYALSFSILNNFTNQFFVMMFIGGVLFAISDLVLSRTYFGEGHETPIDFVLNYIFYYSAQFVIALSLFLPAALR